MLDYLSATGVDQKGCHVYVHIDRQPAGSLIRVTARRWIVDHFEDGTACFHPSVDAPTLMSMLEATLREGPAMFPYLADVIDEFGDRTCNPQSQDWLTKMLRLPIEWKICLPILRR